MTLARRVMWREGMFLRPQHFQQQDLHAASALAARIDAAMPFHWGFTRLEIDAGRLEAGQVGLVACAGAFPDGALFEAPGAAAEIAPLPVPADVDPCLVWLCAPATGPGAALGLNPPDGGAASPARYVVRPEPVRDVMREGFDAQPLELGAMNLRLMLGARPQGYDALPVARVIEVAQGRVRLDPAFIPPILRVAASPRLFRATGEIAARLDARAAQLAGPLGVAGGLSAGANQQLMLLSLCAGKAAVFQHFEQTGGLLHPEALYRACVETAAQLAVFTDRQTRRAPAAPAYDHDDPAACFGAVLAVIEAALGALDEPEARQIPLEYHPRQRIHYNRALDPTLLTGARVFILASDAMPDEAFRAALPANVSIGSTGEILEIMSAAGRSVPIRPLAHFPPELRPLAGWVCFELDRNAPAWAGIAGQRSIAIHTQDAFQNLQLQLWAIRD